MPKFKVGQSVNWNGKGSFGGKPQKVIITGVKTITNVSLYSFEYVVYVPLIKIPISRRAFLISEENLST